MRQPGGRGCRGPADWPGWRCSEPAAPGTEAGSRAGRGGRRQEAGAGGEGGSRGGTSSSSGPSLLPSSGCCSAPAASGARRGPGPAYRPA